MDKQLYAQVANEFATLKNESKTALKEKTVAITARIPRLGEIDEEIATLGYSLVLEALKTGKNDPSAVETIKEKQKSLEAERTALLLENGYAEDELMPKYRCSICQDEGFVDNKPCACFLKRMSELAYAKSDLSALLDKQCFERFDLSLYPEDVVAPDTNLSSRDIMRYAYNRALSFVADFDEPGKSLLFYGSPGLGKTFLSTSIAKELLDKGKSVIYQTSGKVFAMLEEYKFDKCENREAVKTKIDMLYDCDLLILDDLGTEFMTKYVNSAFFDIINTRIVAGKKTIISTNYTISQIGNVYSERVVSRLLGHYDPVMFFGKDLRIG